MCLPVTRPMKRARLEGPGDSFTVGSVSAVSLGRRAEGFENLGNSTSTTNEILNWMDLEIAMVMTPMTVIME